MITSGRSPASIDEWCVCVTLVATWKACILFPRKLVYKQLTQLVFGHPQQRLCTSQRCDSISIQKLLVDLSWLVSLLCLAPSCWLYSPFRSLWNKTVVRHWIGWAQQLEQCVIDFYFNSAWFLPVFAHGFSWAAGRGDYRWQHFLNLDYTSSSVLTDTVSLTNFNHMFG